MLSRVAGYLRLPSRSRGGKDGSLAKRQRAAALSYEDGAAPVSGGAASAASSTTGAAASPQRRSLDAAAAAASATSAVDTSASSVISLEQRRTEEKEFIKAHDTAEADIWYLIDVRWLHGWKYFVSRGGAPPGPIDNSRLQDSEGRLGTRQGLQPVSDYRGVNADIWNYWHSRYGGGPVVRRRQLDLYAPPVEEDTATAASAPLPPLSAATAPRQPHSARRDEGVRSEDGSASSNSGGRHSVADSPPPRGRSGADSSISQQSPQSQPTPPSSDSGRGRQSTGSAGSGKTSRFGASLPAMKSNAKAAPCCDKCDGPHDTAKCPHFRKSRENHVDATCGLGKGGSASDAVEAPIVRNATVHPQPADGSCLFHSLSFGLSDRSTASSLRRDISSYIAKNPDMTIADTALKDWIRYDSGGGVRPYADRMRGDVWGGGIEMAALTKMRKVNVHVYERCREDGVEGYRRITAFENPDAQKTVNVLYKGRMHYDAISVA